MNIGLPSFHWHFLITWRQRSMRQKKSRAPLKLWAVFNKATNLQGLLVNGSGKCHLWIHWVDGGTSVCIGSLCLTLAPSGLLSTVLDMLSFHKDSLSPGPVEMSRGRGVWWTADLSRRDIFVERWEPDRAVVNLYWFPVDGRGAGRGLSHSFKELISLAFWTSHIVIFLFGYDFSRSQ